MLKRTLTALVLMAIGLPAIIYDGFLYYLLMGTFLVGASWEYVRLFRAVEYEPNEIVTVGGVFAIVTIRAFPQSFSSELSIPLLVGLILLAMTVHVIAFERGREQAAFDFTITVAGIVYIGWLGAYLFDLRNMPNGLWWFLLVLCIVWLGDTGAYTIGAAYGRHKMTPRLSPKKSWEGYIAGLVASIYGGALFAYAFSSMGPRPLAGLIDPWRGAFIGLVIGVLVTFGDLGESMLKRQSGMKDSSNIFPGHGGFFDRIDSWIWGASIGYFMIRLFLL